MSRRFEKLIWIKIQVLPTDAVAQWVEHQCDKPRSWVQILASVIFLFCSVAFFLSLLPDEALGGPISTGVCKNLTMLIQITTYRYEKLLCYIYIIYIWHIAYIYINNIYIIYITQSRWM